MEPCQQKIVTQTIEINSLLNSDNTHGKKSGPKAPEEGKSASQTLYPCTVRILAYFAVRIAVWQPVCLQALQPPDDIFRKRKRDRRQNVLIFQPGPREQNSAADITAMGSMPKFRNQSSHNALERSCRGCHAFQTRWH